MKTVNVHQAKSTLSALLAEVEKGEEIVIARNGQPIARLTRVEAPKRPVRGEWRSLPGWENFKYDPAIFAPMTDKEMEEEGWL
jgi:prevent-host-death family protein